jgi:hypothetical protein
MAGDAALPNGNNGVAIAVGASANTIGGPSAAQGNLISGNTYFGVEIRGTGADSNQLENNVIGTARDRTTPLPNRDGVIIEDGASYNTVGVAGQGNLIADNTRAGVGVIGVASTGNTITQNSIFGNGGLGIDITNPALNPPALVNGGSPGTVTGTFTGGANSTITIEFFASATNTPGEGETYLGSVTVTTDSSGNASFTFNFTPVAGEPHVTATATDQNGDTSEFSGPV